MNCARCGGLQLWSHFESLGTSVGAWAYDGWRCMNCGDVVDPLIVENRSLQQPAPPSNRVRSCAADIIWLRPRRDARAHDDTARPSTQETGKAVPGSRRLAG